MNCFLNNDRATLPSNDSISPEEKLDNLRLKDPNRLIFAQLNKIYVRNKLICEQILPKVISAS